ncbi:hypothetical protein SUDANB145_06734 [Streptomyces sp. enrichment culture]|uniref:hypothetical protein n=1 Tax=Streptomyces sp. enrichment culture TaxID=1795815 RepID=UPI003F565D5A
MRDGGDGRAVGRMDFLPRRTGTASGVTLGLTVSAGGLAAPALGAPADAASSRTALLPLIALPAGRLLLRGLREPAPVRRERAA